MGTVVYHMMLHLKKFCSAIAVKLKYRRSTSRAHEYNPRATRLHLLPEQIKLIDFLILYVSDLTAASSIGQPQTLSYTDGEVKSHDSRPSENLVIEVKCIAFLSPSTSPCIKSTDQGEFHRDAFRSFHQCNSFAQAPCVPPAQATSMLLIDGTSKATCCTWHEGASNNRKRDPVPA